MATRFSMVSSLFGVLPPEHRQGLCRSSCREEYDSEVKSIENKPGHSEEKEQTSRMDNNSSTTVSNGNDFLIKMDHMLDELEPRPSSGTCIYRVPMEIRKVNEEAYTPRIVSIGPFHHNNKNLKSMEQLKKGYMKKLVRRNGNSSLKGCTDFVKEKEAEIRECYSEHIEMDSEEFRKMGVLEIPRFLLTTHTEIQIRNIMALELLLFPNKCFVTDYFFLMDCLVNTTMDVDLLVHKKIIINYLGDNKAAADFINNLCINVLLSKNFYFSQVCKELNEYYDVPSHKLKAMLKHDYFRTPCLAASTIAAITFLVLTFIQTVCTVMSAINGK
ncbi:hypothetical protein LguiA_033063 [Lonicera macranthoides]